MARSLEEEQRRRRRRRLVKGLLMGGAAVGVPALVNVVVARRAKNVPETAWGSRDIYTWRGADIAYQHLGAGEPLVLLHSFGAGHSSAEWRRAAEQLAPSFEVFVPDLPGWGFSEPPLESPRPQLYIEWLKDFVVEVVGRPVVLVAAGLSAAYALQIAADVSDQVSALALAVPLGLDSYGRPPEARDAVMNSLLRLPILGTSALNIFTSRAAIATYLRREVYASPNLVDDALVDLHYTHSHRPGRQRSLTAFVSGYLNHDVKALLPRIEQPLWLAWGRRSAVSGVEAADRWLLRLGPAELEIFEQAGALPHAESPREFGRKLERFLIDGPKGGAADAPSEGLGDETSRGVPVSE